MVVPRRVKKARNEKLGFKYEPVLPLTNPPGQISRSSTQKRYARTWGPARTEDFLIPRGTSLPHHYPNPKSTLERVHNKLYNIEYHLQKLGNIEKFKKPKLP